MSGPESQSDAPENPRITAPGIYDMPEDIYHQDPAETPSLSASMINDILLAPKKCWYNSPRLNPAWEPPEDDGKFTIGTVSHIIHLEPYLFADRVMVCDYDDWKKNEAKAKRAAAKAEGKTPILRKHADKVLAARAAFLENEFTASAFRGGKSEQSLFWRHPRYGFWCRARPDYLVQPTHMCDYKATTDANPEKFGRHAYNMNYHRRAAWYLEGYRIVFGERLAHYWFISQEIKPPYLPSVVELDMSALEAGHVENERGAKLFSACLTHGDWYGYRHKNEPNRDLAFQVGLPTYAYLTIDGRS